MKCVFDIPDKGERVDVSFGTDVGLLNFIIDQLSASGDEGLKVMIDRLKEYKDKCRHKQSVWIYFGDRQIKSIEPLNDYITRKGFEKKEFIDETEFGLDEQD